MSATAKAAERISNSLFSYLQFFVIINYKAKYEIMQLNCIVLAAIVAYTSYY